MNPLRLTWVAASAGLLTVLLTMMLGRWQLGRADEKQATAQLIVQRQQLPAWTQADWPCVPASSAHTAQGARAQLPQDMPVHRPVRLRGAWLPERTVFLDNRQMGGAPGFFVVTPLRLSASGACGGRVVLVQRGWVPRHAGERSRLPDWREATGEVEVVGRVMARVSQAYAIGEEAPPSPSTSRLIRQNVDEAFWLSWMGQSPLPGAVLQVHAEMGSPADLRRDWPQPDAGVDKHHAYAAQWFAMSAVAAGLTLWFPFIRPRRLLRQAARDRKP